MAMRQEEDHDAVFEFGYQALLQADRPMLNFERCAV